MAINYRLSPDHVNDLINCKYIPLMNGMLNEDRSFFILIDYQRILHHEDNCFMVFSAESYFDSVEQETVYTGYYQYCYSLTIPDPKNIIDYAELYRFVDNQTFHVYCTKLNHIEKKPQIIQHRLYTTGWNCGFIDIEAKNEN